MLILCQFKKNYKYVFLIYVNFMLIYAHLCKYHRQTGPHKILKKPHEIFKKIKNSTNYYQLLPGFWVVI